MRSNEDWKRSITCSSLELIKQRKEIIESNIILFLKPRSSGVILSFIILNPRAPRKDTYLSHFSLDFHLPFQVLSSITNTNEKWLLTGPGGRWKWFFGTFISSFFLWASLNILGLTSYAHKKENEEKIVHGILLTNLWNISNYRIITGGYLSFSAAGRDPEVITKVKDGKRWLGLNISSISCRH